MKKYSGTLFYAHLTPEGFESLKDPTNDVSVVMMNAYQLLFKLENYMRRFIESRLISYYRNDWWENGISRSIKEKVTSNKINEKKAIWQVSEISSDVDYLYFEDLKGVIIKNWKEIFESVFLNLDKVKSKLDVLEDIRNAIAHTRILTKNAMIRLQQNYDDLMSMMNIGQSNK